MRQRFVEEGLDVGIKQRPGSGRKRKKQGEHEAHLIAWRCSEPPVGHARWTLRLLADQMVELGYIDEQLVKFDPEDPHLGVNMGILCSSSNTIRLPSQPITAF